MSHERHGISYNGQVDFFSTVCSANDKEKIFFVLLELWEVNPLVTNAVVMQGARTSAAMALSM